MFITFEGLDYSGKTTQAKRLISKLRQSHREPVYFREPGSTWLSNKIRETLLDSRHLIELNQTEISYIAEMFLFSAARTQLVQDQIIPALGKGQIVVCDRFYDSTTAYQGYGRGLDIEDIKKVNQIAALGKKPDVTFLLDIVVDEVMHRKTYDDLFRDRFEQEAIEFYSRVRSGYLEMAREESDRFVVVDGTKSTAEIHAIIWNKVQAMLHVNARKLDHAAKQVKA
jgi:dTMP kinase